MTLQSASIRAYPLAVVAAPLAVLLLPVMLFAFEPTLDWRLRLGVILAFGLAAVLIVLLFVRRHRLSTLLLRTETSLRQMQEVTNDLRMTATTGEETIRDAGTLLHSRPFMEEVLGRELMRASRAHEALTLMLFHLEGLENADPRVADRTLRAVGLTLQKRARSFDVVCRFDRQVLGLLLPGLSEQEVGRRCHDLVTAGEESRAQLRSSPTDPVAIAAGMAVHGRHDPPEDSLALFRRAMVSLYQSRTRLASAAAVPAVASRPELGADPGMTVSSVRSPVRL